MARYMSKKKPETINGLKAKVKELEEKLKNVEKDREIYRKFATEEFKKQLTCITKNEHYAPKHIVERLTILFNSAEKFYLWF